MKKTHKSRETKNSMYCMNKFNTVEELRRQKIICICRNATHFSAESQGLTCWRLLCVLHSLFSNVHFGNVGLHSDTSRDSSGSVVLNKGVLQLISPVLSNEMNARNVSAQSVLFFCPMMFRGTDSSSDVPQKSCSLERSIISQKSVKLVMFYYMTYFGLAQTSHFLDGHAVPFSLLTS